MWPVDSVLGRLCIGQPTLIGQKQGVPESATSTISCRDFNVWFWDE
jgi:hypothetical protein